MKRVVAVFCVFCLISAGSIAFAQQASDLIAAADAAFDRWTQPFEFDLYQEKLETAVSLWEEALPLLADAELAVRAHVLNRLAQAYFELGEAYLSTTDERVAAYEKGRDYALESLRLDPIFRATEESAGFRAALYAANDIAAIFWYGNAAGKWYDFHQIQAIFGGVLDVLASYERAAELDETYFGGAPHRSLAALIAQAYFVIGMDREDCVAHYERAIELDPHYLETYVNYAQHYAIPTKQTEEALRLLAIVDQGAQDPQLVAQWPLYNFLAIRQAGQLEP
jgi:tetratricopeptide (TPR) repeat protein